MPCDAIVIGSGSAGCAAALEGAERGLQVLLVDDGWLHATSPPYVAAVTRHLLLETVAWALDERRRFMCADDVQTLSDLRWGALRAHARELAACHVAGMRAQLSAAGVGVRSEAARLLSGRSVHFENGDVEEAPIVIVATGSRPGRPRQLAHDGAVVLDETSLCGLDRTPMSLLVVGADESGCELACAFAALGSEVTLLDRRTRMLRYVDRDAVDALHAHMQAMGVEVVLGESVVSIEAQHDGEPHALVALESGRSERWEKVLISAGRRGNTQDLAAEEAGVATDGMGFVVTQDAFLTSREGIYAVGEVISRAGRSGSPWWEGRWAMRQALGLEARSPESGPLLIHTIPEIGMAGLTAEMCQRLDFPHVVGTAPLVRFERPQRAGALEGRLKLVVGTGDGRVVGVQVMGPNACELVQFAALCVGREVSGLLAGFASSAPTLAASFAAAAVACLDQLGQPADGMP
jgi:NAD(P) transhydrogenase